MIESFCKTKIRQSVSVQDSVGSPINNGHKKESILQRNESTDRKQNDENKKYV